MRQYLKFVEPIAYVTDGIIIKGYKDDAIRHQTHWDDREHTYGNLRPTKYQIIMNDGCVADLSIQHCRQIDEYLDRKKQRDNPFNNIPREEDMELYF